MKAPHVTDMEALTTGLATKADKMRVLERADYSRADIARFLNVRYQQVRNTLEGDKRTGYNPVLSDPAATSDGGSAFAELDLDSNGSLTLPPDLVEAIPGESGDPIYVLKLADGLFVTSLDAAMARLARGLT